MADFDPSSLFGGSDQGVVFDNTDTANLFQLSTGSTAVAAGDPIGWTTDLSGKGNNAVQATAGSRPIWRGVPRTLDADIVSNGEFDTDTVWSKGTGWTISGGVATKTAGTASDLTQSLTLTAGTTYMAFYKITRTAGTVRLNFTGGTTQTGVAANYGGSHYEVFTATAGNNTVAMVADSAFAGTVSRVAIFPVTSFTNMGACFDGVDDRLRTSNINFTASDKMTVIASMRIDKAAASRTAVEFGNYLAGTNGSGSIGIFPDVQARIKGDTALAQISTPSGGVANNYKHYVMSAEFDLAGATIPTELNIRSAGILGTQTPSGSTAGGGSLVNGAVTVGSPFNSATWWKELIHRVIVINRILTSTEKANAEAWVKDGMVYCAVMGDSTVSRLDSSSGFNVTAAYTSSLVGGMVTGIADVSDPGDRIADQKTLWTAIADKSALQAVFIQIGLNDVKGRVGENLATTAQVIADLQDLVDTVNADKPAGCKTYICGLTPCKTWLNLATNPTAAYQAWLDVNEAIAGGGSTPITGVDGRITSYVAALNDGSGNLLPAYDTDGVHETTEARFIIAQAWRDQMEADYLFGGEPPVPETETPPTAGDWTHDPSPMSYERWKELAQKQIEAVAETEPVIVEAVDEPELTEIIYQPVENYADLLRDLRALKLDYERQLYDAMMMRNAELMARLAYEAALEVQREKEALIAFMWFMD